mmetsp:Transcript_94307/g.236763  ORF Transcript_94307/g.236763 Transcript_94307/m.236763 type:complete len:298 (+) Transcript_94307:1524-2417(+)
MRCGACKHSLKRRPSRTRCSRTSKQSSKRFGESLPKRSGRQTSSQRQQPRPTSRQPGRRRCQRSRCGASLSSQLSRVTVRIPPRAAMSARTSPRPFITSVPARPSASVGCDSLLQATAAAARGSPSQRATQSSWRTTVRSRGLRPRRLSMLQVKCSISQCFPSGQFSLASGQKCSWICASCRRFSPPAPRPPRCGCFATRQHQSRLGQCSSSRSSGRMHRLSELDKASSTEGRHCTWLIADRGRCKMIASSRQADAVTQKRTCRRHGNSNSERRATLGGDPAWAVALLNHVRRACAG